MIVALPGLFSYILFYFILFYLFIFFFCLEASCLWCELSVILFFYSILCGAIRYGFLPKCTDYN